MPTTLSEGLYASDWLKGDQQSPMHYSRELVTILAGSGSARSLTSGMVCGRATLGAASSEPDAGNTGNGVMGAVTVLAGAKPGVYTLRVVEAAANAGRFTLEDPDGYIVGEGNVASAFDNGELSFTLADGAADFIVGDEIYITVAAGTGKVVQIDFSATNGTAKAAGILLDDAEAPDGVDGEGVLIVRNATVDPVQLVWPTGATTGQKNAALAQLAARGILQRKGE